MKVSCSIPGSRRCFLSELAHLAFCIFGRSKLQYGRKDEYPQKAQNCSVRYTNGIRQGDECRSELPPWPWILRFFFFFFFFFFIFAKSAQEEFPERRELKAFPVQTEWNNQPFSSAFDAGKGYPW